MGICSIDDCERKSRCNGYCSMHHQRNRRHGSPLINKALHHGKKVLDMPEYTCYNRIKSSTQNPNHTKYYIYGGRGIEMCDRWLFGEDGKTGFICFLEDMGEKPTPQHSIERKEVNGNYEPSNCVWATSVVQGRNKRKFKNNTSGQSGVYWLKADNIWVAKIGVNYKEIVIGRFHDKKDAIKARLDAEKVYWV